MLLAYSQQLMSRHEVSLILGLTVNPTNSYMRLAVTFEILEGQNPVSRRRLGRSVKSVSRHIDGVDEELEYSGCKYEWQSNPIGLRCTWVSVYETPHSEVLYMYIQNLVTLIWLLTIKVHLCIHFNYTRPNYSRWIWLIVLGYYSVVTMDSVWAKRKLNKCT